MVMSEKIMEFVEILIRDIGGKPYYDMKDVKAVKITVERLDESEVEENAELV